MKILVVGSVGLDTVETPFGSAKDALGGSAIYFSAAASYFAPVRIVGVVGDDFACQDLSFLVRRNVDLQGLETKPGDTFRWGANYHYDLNTRDTTFTHLNVFEDFTPVIPETYRDSDLVFLANIAPDLQLDVLQQIDAPKLVALDTMNYWIERTLSELKQVLQQTHVLIVNDSEVRLLAEEPNLVKAAHRIQDMGPKIIVIKKGEHGALMVAEENVFFFAPAYPLEQIEDPTGAGDTFAGGFIGYLARTGNFSTENFRKALVVGSSMASFCVERFSLNRLKDLQASEISQRFNSFWEMTRFEKINSGF